MSKFGKFLSFSLLAGAAAAGTMYFLRNREAENNFEDSGNDVNDDLEAFLKSKSSGNAAPAEENRSYVPLNFNHVSSESASETTPAPEQVHSIEPEAAPMPEPIHSIAPESAKPVPEPVYSATPEPAPTQDYSVMPDSFHSVSAQAEPAFQAQTQPVEQPDFTSQGSMNDAIINSAMQAAEAAYQSAFSPENSSPVEPAPAMDTVSDPVPVVDATPVFNPTEVPAPEERSFKNLSRPTVEKAEFDWDAYTRDNFAEEISQQNNVPAPAPTAAPQKTPSDNVSDWSSAIADYNDPAPTGGTIKFETLSDEPDYDVKNLTDRSDNTKEASIFSDY